MLTNGLKTAIIASAAAIALSACTGHSSYDDKTISFSQLTQSKAFTLDDSAQSYGTDNDIVFFDSVSMLIPTLVGNHDIRAFQDSIFKAAFDTIGVDHKSIIDSYFLKTPAQSGFEISAIDTDTTSLATAGGYELVTGAVINLTPELIVYCVTNESYIPGAAHGMTIKQYVNYNTVTGKVITLNDIFTPEGLRQLPAIIAKRASDLSSVFGPTDVNALPTDGNFYISPAGEIVFAYQPYEIASYAQGLINIPFYPYELIDYLTSDALVMFNLTDLN